MSYLTKLPFIAEGTIAANKEVTLYVKNDIVHGLQKPGRTGYVQNDGPGTILVQTIDNMDGPSDTSTILINEQLIFEKDDDIDVNAIHITADALGASYRARFARARE